MPKDDLVRVRHMLDAAKEARSFVQQKARSDLDSNRTLVLALVRSIEIIGEAAARTTKEFQAKHPAVPWSEIIAMRNRLIHAYFDVDVDRIWDTVTDDLPPLIARLEQLVRDELPKQT